MNISGDELRDKEAIGMVTGNERIQFIGYKRGAAKSRSGLILADKMALVLSRSMSVAMI